MFFEFFAWWYGRGWINAWLRAGRWVTKVQMEFSIPVLLRTLFSPWRQIVSLPGRTIDQRFRAALDNFISRCVGFFVRLIVLVCAVLIMTIVGLAGLIVAIAWPFVPVAFIYFVYRSLLG
jgi:hypothetical protein